MTEINFVNRLFPCPEAKVLDLFGIKGIVLTIKEIGDRSELDRRTVKRVLGKFEELGVIRKLGQRIEKTDLYEFNSELISGIIREANALILRLGI